MLKKNVACLLRQGVQELDQDGRMLSEKQSFIACMAAMRQDDRPKTIAEMKQIILDGITLDSFLTYQNGALLDAFKPAPGQEKEVHASASTNKGSQYVQKMTAKMKDKNAETRGRMREAMSNTINAYENFRRFIASNDTVIDHTYMWDIFTTLNPKIFNTQQQRMETVLAKGATKEQVAQIERNIGFNLIILEIPKDDNSDALNIVCPSNHYSNNQFNSWKPTVILIKQYNYYEPVYQFTDHDNAKKSDIKKTFSLRNATTLMPNLKVMIELIRDQILPSCAPINVKPYAFKYNISADDAISILKKAKFTINRLVMNYDSKVIGLEVEKRNSDGSHLGIVMTAASPLNPHFTDIDMELAMMDDPAIWTSYEDTLLFLEFVSKETKAQIPCLPRINIVDDNHLIGIMTETNQFMEIQPHLPKTEIPHVPLGMKPLETIEYNNPNTVDAEVQTGSKEDADRAKYVRRIQLETEMYTLFRNSMRIMINKIKNMQGKKRLEDIVTRNDGTRTHPDKLREIMRICREMGDASIHFTRMSDAVLDAFKLKSAQFMQCISAENRFDYAPNTCMRTVNAGAKECVLFFPHKNLINGIDNRTLYYGKFADELLRYTRIQRFILSSTSSFSSLTPIAYDLHSKEIILLHSQLDPYFEHLTTGTGTDNTLVRYNSFATANPELNPGEVPSSNYVAEMRTESPAAANASAANASAANANASAVCAPFTLMPLSASATRYFPKTMQLLAFDNANAEGECTFEAFISIMKEERANYHDVTVRELKDILVGKYIELSRTHKVQLMNYYKHLTANRRILAANVQDFIMNSFHYMTHLDMWLLAEHFHIPIVLFAGHVNHPLIENQRPALVLYHERRDDVNETNAVFYYVMSTGRTRDVAPNYSIVRTQANDMKFPLSQCSNAEFVTDVMNQVVVGMGSVAQFVAEYVPVVKKRIALKDADA